MRDRRSEWSNDENGYTGFKEGFGVDLGLLYLRGCCSSLQLRNVSTTVQYFALCLCWSLQCLNLVSDCSHLSMLTEWWYVVVNIRRALTTAQEVIMHYIKNAWVGGIREHADMKTTTRLLCAHRVSLLFFICRFFIFLYEISLQLPNNCNLLLIKGKEWHRNMHINNKTESLRDFKRHTKKS